MSLSNNRLKIGMDDVGSTVGPTSSMPIFKELYLVIYKH